MNRIKVPSGSIQKLEKVFDDLQTKIQKNVKDNTDLWLHSNGGLDLNITNGVIPSSDTGLKVELFSDADHPTRFVVRAGKAVAPNGEIYELETDFTYTQLVNPAANTMYLVTARQIELGSEPTPAQNAFLFDSSGSTPYSTQNTVFINKLQITLYPISDTTQLNADPQNVNLAIIKTGLMGDNFQYLETGWTGNTAEHVPVNGVIDLRKASASRLKPNLFDDTLVLLKDRDSIGTNAINGSVKVNKDFTVGEDLLVGSTVTVSGQSLFNDNMILYKSSGDSMFSLIAGAADTNKIRFSDTDTSFISEIVSDDDNPFYIAQGGSGSSFSKFYIDSAGKTIIGNYPTHPQTAQGDLDIVAQGNSVETSIRLAALSNLNTNDKNTLYDIKAVTNDAGSGAGKLVFKPSVNNRDIEFQTYNSDTPVVDIDLTNEKLVLEQPNVSSTSSNPALHVKGFGKFDGSITVNGTNSYFGKSSFTRAVAGQDAIITQGSIEINPYAVNEATDLHLKDGVALTVNQNATIGGTLGVTGDTTLGDLYLTGQIESATQINSTLTTTGDITAPNATLSNNLTVNGNATLGASDADNITLNGTITTFTADTGKLNTALNVEPGALATFKDDIHIKTNAADTSYGAGLKDGKLTLGDAITATASTDSMRVHSETHTIMRLTAPSEGRNSLIFGAGSTGDNFKITTANDYSHLNIGAGVSGLGLQIDTSNNVSAENITVDSLSVSSNLDMTTAALNAQSVVANAGSIGGINLTSALLDCPVTFNAGGTSLLNDVTINGSVNINDDGSNVHISGTSSEEFRVGVGGSVEAGKLVRLVQDGYTIPSYFRIYDFGPSWDKESNSGRLTFKWNFDNLNVTTNFSPNISGWSQEPKNVKITGSYDSLENQQLFQYLNSESTVGKLLYFPSSGKRIKIEAFYALVEQGNTEVTRWFVLEEDPDTAVDVSSPTNPARVIDANCSGYKLKITRSIGGSASAEREIKDLDVDYVTNPTFITTLKTEQSYFFELKPYNHDSDGNYITMSGGVYDPDHDGLGSGQGLKTYDFPWNASLPEILPAGTLTLTGTAFGFNLQVAGWEQSTGNTENDYDNTAHNWEIIYGTTSGINFSDYTNTTHIITDNRLLPITSNVPALFHVKARALQNGSVVSPIISESIVAGGGGTSPEETILANESFNIIVHSGLITNDYSGQSGAFAIDTEEVATGGSSLIFGNNTLAGSQITVTPSGQTPGGTQDLTVIINDNYLTEQSDPPFSG